MYSFKMSKFYLIIPAIIVLLMASISIVESRTAVVLDKESDIFRSWTISGDYDYIPSGSHLRSRAKLLPEKFRFKSFYNIKGIWCIFPISPDARIEEFGQPVSNITSAEFEFRSVAQLLDSVALKYNMGGPTANIIIRKGFTKDPLMNITSQSVHIEDGCITTTVPLDITTQFTIEANAVSEGDYILIDRIEAIFLETTTSTTTTTAKPTSLPLSTATIITPKWVLMILISLFIIL